MVKNKEKTEDNSRTRNFLRNTVVGMITQLFSLILSFVSRTVFIQILSNDYLSINGLFYNILSTLSFVELGFGTALIYMMYKPVVDNDKEKIKMIMHYYKKVYYVIGVIIFVLGLCVIPFMDFIIKDPPQIHENLNLIYILFLLSTCIGYFYSHKTAIINAYQKNYIISLYNQIFKWVQLVFQIIFLLLTKNYIIYLVIHIICTLLNNISISIKANKLFPFIKEKNVKEIPKEDKKKINNKVKSLIFYRLNPSILNGSDNLIISAFIGVSYIGIYSNYYLITNYLSMFINQITGALESSIGNLNANASKAKKEDIFYKVLFLCFFIYGMVCILLMALMNDFIHIWLGDEFLFNNFIVFTILFYIYMNGVNFTCYSFRTTSGLFEKAKLVPLFEVILNIVISIVLAKIIGVAGVFLGTSIAKFLTFFWTDPKLLYANLFEKKNIKKYFYKYFKYLFITLSVGGLVFYLSSLVEVSNYLTWFLKALVLGLITLLIFVALCFKTNEFRGMMDNIKERFLPKFVRMKKEN